MPCHTLVFYFCNQYEFTCYVEVLHCRALHTRKQNSCAASSYVFFCWNKVQFVHKAMPSHVSLHFLSNLKNTSLCLIRYVFSGPRKRPTREEKKKKKKSFRKVHHQAYALTLIGELHSDTQSRMESQVCFLATCGTHKKKKLNPPFYITDLVFPVEL